MQNIINILRIHSVKLKDTALWKKFMKKMQHKPGVSDEQNKKLKAFINSRNVGSMRIAN